MVSVRITDKLAVFINTTKYDQLPKDIVDAAKNSFLDFLAVSIAGYRKGPLSRIIIPYLLQIGGKCESTVLGTDKKIPAINAALANGISGHSMDLDDGHRKALGHPGVSVIPAALAVAELIGCSGRQLLTAIIIGYELFIRIGQAANPALLNRGFHTTGVCGALSAAAAVAKVLSLSKEKIVSTLGIAGTQSSGLLVVIYSGQMIKPLNAGKAAQSGVIAALLAQKGVIGSVGIIEGKDGFMQTFSNKSDYSSMLNSLGKNFVVKECYKKYYPACRHTHAAIDAALYLKNDNNFNIQDIQEIKIITYPVALKLTQKEKMPKDEAGARFNIAFAVSLAIVKGKAGINEFSMENTKNQQIGDLFNKVKIISDYSFESKENNIRGAEVEIILKDDTRLKKRVLLPKGEPENPATKQELYDKYYSCIGNFWTIDKKEEVWKCIQDLENIDNIKTLMDLITKCNNFE